MPLQLSRRAVGLVAAAAVIGGTLAAAPAAYASSGSVTIASTKPAWLARGTRVPAGIRPFTATTAPQTVRVYLAPNHGLAHLQADVAKLSDPTSSSYRKWWSATAYNNYFMPTSGQVSRVKTYLTSMGLTIASVGPNRRYIVATGDASSLDKAFGVQLSTWQHDGQTVVAPSTDVVLPASIASSVLTVSGLDTTTFTKTHDDVTPPTGYTNGKPCSAYFGQVAATYQADYTTKLPTFNKTTLPYAVCGYTGPQLRAAYENNSVLDGTGVTVAITDAYSSQYMAADAATYATNHGDAGYAKGQLTILPAATSNSEATCDPSGWSGEESLDVEAVHAMAGGAKIRYYGSASCNDDDLLDALGRVVDDNKAQIVTNSWGDPDWVESSANIVAYEQVLLQGAMQGISFLWSSGDNGDELANTGLKQTDYPASDPYATGVGGTSTSIDASATLTQVGWGTEKYSLAANGKSWTPVGYLYGAGGGYSSLFNRPAYQKTVVPVSAPAGRAVPDVAMDADPTTGMLIGLTQTFTDSVRYGEYRIGGTSLASPLFAGMTALRIQSLGGKGLGWLNPKLYSSTALFTDVVPSTALQGAVRAEYANSENPDGGMVYSVRTFDQDSTLATAKGWDPVTGIGVPSTTWLTAK